jgi:hypothetical protein
LCIRDKEFPESWNFEGGYGKSGVLELLVGNAIIANKTNYIARAHQKQGYAY